MYRDAIVITLKLLVGGLAIQKNLIPPPASGSAKDRADCDEIISMLAKLRAFLRDEFDVNDI